MIRQRPLKLALLILLVAMIFFGTHPGGPASAIAGDCPEEYPTDCDSSPYPPYYICHQTCSYVSTVCDEWGSCCCEYASSGGSLICPEYCY
jgi:hypothetical protein